MTGLDYIGIINNKTFTGAILEDLGFKLIVPNQRTATYGEIAISLETLPQFDSDLIIVMASENSSVAQVKQVWANNSILRLLPSLSKQSSLFVDYQLWNRIQGAISAELVIVQVREMLLSKNEV